MMTHAQGREKRTPSPMQRGLADRRRALLNAAQPELRGPASNTRPRGNQRADRGDTERGIEKLWAILG
jgi:hypothetical protein